MCGIVGVVVPHWKLERRRLFCTTAMEALKARGPDGKGYLDGACWSFGHRRLSIIDVPGGQQPMSDGSGRYTIVFNGEITNYQIVRTHLRQAGHYFNTASDTEVVLRAFMEWGERCVYELEGMYAFAIIDELSESLFIARDPLGIKPLYYKFIEDGIVFASEIRALYASGEVKFEPAWENINEFLIFGSVAGEQTLHKDIYELPGGHWARWQRDKWDMQRFWYPIREENTELGDTDAACTELAVEVERAIQNWTVSDVGLGVFLSGGLDSGVVAAVAANHIQGLRSFTISMPNYDVADERQVATLVAKRIGSEHTNVVVGLEYQNTANTLTELANLQDHPLHDSNSLTLYMLCYAVRQKSDLRVILTGDGADELFAGYRRHAEIAESYRLSRNPEIINLANNWMTIERMKLFAESDKIANTTRLDLAHALRGDTALRKVLEFDQLCFLPPYLRRMDCISMGFGMEMRPALLDHKLVEYANAIASDQLVGKADEGNITKYPLRQVASQLLPSNVAWNKKKVQFSLPSSQMFDRGGPLHTLARETFSDGCFLEHIYDPIGIRELLQSHSSQSESSDHSNTLFRLLALELWLDSMWS
jgi:asparagine synthase (glutamine-hydrolysing)